MDDLVEVTTPSWLQLPQDSIPWKRESENIVISIASDIMMVRERKKEAYIPTICLLQTKRFRTWPPTPTASGGRHRHGDDVGDRTARGMERMV
ncbi:hypothetical protein EVAR_42681_1 [Eumeta japonica]|uniref:Uncharacterized protein n=1 Tax=Eumeta variegata TaxID=151549 RepID=A0A4C1X289_EUMVA|nr:hypothetical protein EVAR_42681_1 [Eumeta japonica]